MAVCSLAAPSFAVLALASEDPDIMQAEQTETEGKSGHLIPECRGWAQEEDDEEEDEKKKR